MTARSIRSRATLMDNGDVSEQRPPTRKKRHTPRNHSSSRQKQQTLTQMDFVSFNNPDLEDYDLEYVAETDFSEAPIKDEMPSMPHTQRVVFKTEDDYTLHNEEDATYQDIDHGRHSKRRRRTRAQSLEAPQIYTRVQTRSSSRRISSNGENLHEIGNPVSYPASSLDMRERSIPRDDGASQTESEIYRLNSLPIIDTQTSSPNAKESQIIPDSDAMRMPPPCTPHKQKLKEIPSSQSPPATPWSIKSRALVKSATQSPLQQKSANAPKSIYVPSVQRKKQPRLALEIEETPDDDDDKENRSAMSITISPILNPRRTPASSARRPLQRVVSSSGSEREVMADLARITSAATSSIAELKSLVEVAPEISDSDGEELERELGNHDDERRLEERRETSCESEPIMPDLVDTGKEEVAPPIENTLEYGSESESQPYDSLLGPIRRVERTRSQSTVSTVLITPIKTGTLSKVLSDPTTPCQSLPNPAFDGASLELQADLAKSTQVVLTSSTTDSRSGALDEPQDSPSTHRSRRETRTPRSSRSIQRALERSVAKSANKRGVDLGILAGWRRMTESQRLNDSLLQDSLDVENAWDLDLELELDTQRSS